MWAVTTRSRRLISCALAVAAAHALTPAADAGQKQRRVGVDVSRFQGEIKWQRVARTKVEFAYIQASRGDGRVCPVVPERCGADEYYAANYEGAKAAGLRVGAYHRAFPRGRTIERARERAREEAALFVAQTGPLQRRDLRPALDVETPFGALDQRELRAWIATWLRRVERALGTQPVIYTNHSSWQATGNTLRFARDGHLLWVANWGVSEPLVPAGNWDGRGWEVWQFTSSAHVRGISGRVDKNRLRGAFRRLRAL